MALVPCQVLRVAILLSYCSILCNYKAIEMPSHQTYGGSWKFLTFIDLSCQRTEYRALSMHMRKPLEQIHHGGQQGVMAGMLPEVDHKHYEVLLASGDLELISSIFSNEIEQYEGQVFKCASHPLTLCHIVEVIQAVFFGICVLTDLSSLLTRGSGNQEQERQLKKLISLRDWMLAVLAFPVGVFVVAVFWIIYAYDREMIYPKLLDNFIPGWLNHGMASPLRKAYVLWCLGTNNAGLSFLPTASPKEVSSCSIVLLIKNQQGSHSSKLNCEMKAWYPVVLGSCGKKVLCTPKYVGQLCLAFSLFSPNMGSKCLSILSKYPPNCPVYQPGYFGVFDPGKPLWALQAVPAPSLWLVSLPVTFVAIWAGPTSARSAQQGRTLAVSLQMLR
ncbi:hypothetical protein MG293_010600 [Ovis ammon polii]|uniref:Androgen-induced gene 1 protein n=1 Tax=Ovis ammon polii TaxID=230172 RepID=A0AAD4U2L2_OVIAM|nr:hypothetical protein MG293_010600 [Ovis ammon polii]